MTTKEQIVAQAFNNLMPDLSVICKMLGLDEYSLPGVMERITELSKLAAGNEQEAALLNNIAAAATRLVQSKSELDHVVSSAEREALKTALSELSQQRVLWGFLATNLDFTSQNSIANFLLDAIRYRVLRDESNQLHEDDPCVSDSSFRTYFGKDLDRVADGLCRRAIQLNEKG